MLVEGHLDPEHLVFQVGHELHMLYAQLIPLCLQLHASDDAVPVALRLVGHGMGVLTYAHILNAVVDTDGNLVGFAWHNETRDVVAMRGRERHLTSHLITVDVNLGLDVGPL